MAIKIKAVPYGALPCSLTIFTIKDKPADQDDFIEMNDDGSDYAEDYACGCMVPHSVKATEKVLKKYDITLSEFNEIVEQLKDILYVGSCGWCV
jgi:hypothetical protein